MEKHHELREELRTSTDLNWQSGAIRDRPEGPEVRWILVLRVKPVPEGPFLEVGISSEGKWLIVDGDRCVHLLEGKVDYTAALPFLEMTYGKSKEILSGGLKACGLNDGWVESFPFEDLIGFALKTISSSWPDYALKWIPDMKSTPQIEEGLTHLQQIGRTQNQRHRAAKLLATIRRSSQNKHGST